MDDLEQWGLTLPPPEYEESEILEWTVRELPSQLMSVLQKFTRIPDSDFILPIVGAYELLPLTGLKVVSGLFCYGPSGSGKSTLGNLLQQLNPCYDGSINPLSALDSPNGWLQSLSKYRCISPSGPPKPCPFLAVDDLTGKSLGGETGNLRLQILKQLPNSMGCVSKGSADGDPIEYHTFSKFAISSISDLPSIEGLSELNRRVIVVRHKNVSEWIDSEWSDFNRDIHLEKPDDYTGWKDYPMTKILWLKSVAESIQSDRSKVKRFCKKNRDNYPIPEQLLDFYNPLIAIGITAGFWELEQGVEIFGKLVENNQRTENDSHLKTILNQWIQLDEGYGKYLRRFQSKGYGFEVEYSKVVKFLKDKVSNNELIMREIARPLIVAALSDLGFTVRIEGATIAITMGEMTDD